MIVKSQDINQIQNEAKKTFVYEFTPSTWNKAKTKEVVLNSEISDMQFSYFQAFKHFLNNATQIETIKATLPPLKIYVGNIINIRTPEYAIPSENGGEKFIVTRVERVYKNNPAFFNIEAKRWNF